MIVKETKLKGCYVIEPAVFCDERGFFQESYNKNAFEHAIGREINFVQDNQSFSKYGVIRALHYQIGDFAQAKLVRVLNGEVLDIAVDLRRSSPTFGQHFSIKLSGENNKQLFIPRGFAHGFSVLSETADFFYKCDNYYDKSSEGGIIYNDAEIGIDWEISSENALISEKDLQLPTLSKAIL
jgi:dTDP-4-dehydrorhamnose 3,5-epimerase